jgi:hypothetical protein
VADGVELDPGTGGALVATDDAGVAGQVQIIKLAVSANGSATVIPADATNGLFVDVTRSALPTGASTSAKQDTEITALQAIQTAVEILDNTVSGSETQVDVVAALPAGANAIGKLAANSGVDIGDVDVTSISAGTNAIGNVGVVPRTTGGLTTFHLVSAGSTNATSVKASAGQLFGWYIYNSNAAARKVAFHNTAGTPTAGASVFFSVVIPPTSAANVFSEIGIAFGTGIGITTVTELTDAGGTGVAASDLIINLFYS